MTILITGGAGYIGSHMALKLADAGEEAVILDDLTNGSRHLAPRGMAFFEGDVADRLLLDRLLTEHDIEAVIHFAGSIVVPESVENPLAYYDNNTAKSRTLIEACVAHGVENFIFSSTAVVYGAPDIAPLTEDMALQPISPYATSKLMTEWMLRDAAAAHDFRYLTLRYFNVAGADPDGRSGQPAKQATHLIKVGCQVALGKRDQLTIFGTDYPTPDGTCVRDYIHVSDLVEAHYLALKHLRGGGGCRVYNCGYGKGSSVRDVVAAFGEVIGRPLPVDVGSRRPGDAPILVADSTRLQRDLGWRPRHDDLRFIIRTALDWEKSLGTRADAAVRV